MAKDAVRWAGRPVSSATVSGLAFLIPLAVAVLVGWFARGVVRLPEPLGLQAIWWLGQVGLAALVFAVVGRVTRRLLPLAALLKMTLLFPDRAPSRLAVARRAGRTKDLEARVDQTMNETPTGSIGDAAERILSLATALNSHDRRTRGHSERVRVLTDMIADELELSEDARDRLRWASLLHDIGKLTVHPDILNKPGKPNAEEWVALQKHPLEGAKLTAPLVPWLGEWALAVEQHHEKYDGQGYPYGLAGPQISYGARIVAVADVFETMTAKRSYKDALSPAVARAELTRCAGSQFDADIVRAFLNISLGRLQWAVGPASLIAQLPFVGQIPLIGGQATGALAGLTTATAMGVAVLSVGAIGMPHLVAPTSTNGAHAAGRAVRPADAQLASLTGASHGLSVAQTARPGANTGAITPGANPLNQPARTAPPAAPNNPTTSTPVTSTVNPIPVSAGAPPAIPGGSSTTITPGTPPPVTVPLPAVPKVTTPTITVPPITVPPVTVPRVTVPPITVPPVTAPPATGLLGTVTNLLNGLLGTPGGKH